MKRKVEPNKASVSGKKLYFKVSAIFILILVLALVLRLIHLTIWPVFADEAIYIRWSQIMHNEPSLRFLPLSDGKQPLYMWILMFIVTRLHDPLFAGRLVSVISGCITLGGVAVLTNQLTKSVKASLIAALLWAIIPYGVFFDRMALVDSLLAACAVWSTVCALWMVRTFRLDSAIITGFVIGLGLLTKSPAIFFYVYLLFSFIFLNKDSFKLAKLLKLFLLFMVVVFVSQGMYSVLRLGPNFHLINSRNGDYVYSISHLWQTPLDPLIPHLSEIWDWVMKLCGIGFILLVLYGLINLLKQYRALIFLVACIALPTFMEAEYAKVFTARYLLFALPFLMIIAGIAFAESRHYLIKRTRIAVLILMVAQSLYFYLLLITNPGSTPIPENERSGYLEEWSSGTGIRESADYIKGQILSNPKGQFLVATEGYFGTLPDGMAMYLEGFPRVIIKGVGIDLKEIPQSMIEAKKAGNIVYLAVNSTRILINPDLYGLRLVAAYPKSERVFATREYNLYGPQETFYLFEYIGGDKS